MPREGPSMQTSQPTTGSVPPATPRSPPICVGSKGLAAWVALLPEKGLSVGPKPPTPPPTPAPPGWVGGTAPGAPGLYPPKPTPSVGGIAPALYPPGAL